MLAASQSKKFLVCPPNEQSIRSETCVAFHLFRNFRVIALVELATTPAIWTVLAELKEAFSEADGFAL